MVQPLQPKISTPPTQENSSSNQFSSELNNQRSQLSPESIENSSTISPSTPGRQKAIDNRQQDISRNISRNISRTVQRSPLPIPDNAQKSNIYSQQQLSSAFSSTKSAEIKPLVAPINAQYSQSSIDPKLTDVPTNKIEIKIGRIIVRANEQLPSKTQSSPRRTTAKKPALSLKDYLKQRHTEDRGGRP